MKLAGFDVGLDRPMFLIAGPCVIETETMAIDVAGRLKEITKSLGVPFVYKSSFDKANRSSGKSFRGLGIDEGLRILSEVKRQVGVPVLTDVHVGFQHGSHRFAVEGHDSLIRLLPRHRIARIKRNREAAAAAPIDQLPHRGLGVDRLFAELGGRAHRQIGLAFDDQQLDRTVAMDLHDQRPVELDVGGEQRCCRNHFAQQARDHWRKVVQFNHLSPRAVDAHKPASHWRGMKQELQQAVAHRRVACMRAKVSTRWSEDPRAAVRDVRSRGSFGAATR